MSGQKEKKSIGHKRESNGKEKSSQGGAGRERIW